MRDSCFHQRRFVSQSMNVRLIRQSRVRTATQDGARGDVRAAWRVAVLRRIAR